VDLESLVELIYAAKFAQIDASYGLEPLPESSLTEEDKLFQEQSKKLFITRLKEDLVLFPEVPIPKGCSLVHPMLKDPVRWVTLSLKAKADLYHNKFLNYLENWKKGNAGKHAASVYGFGSYGSPGNTNAKVNFKHLAELDPEWAAESAALDAELAKALGELDLDEAA
jgi:hypothetical protein